MFVMAKIDEDKLKTLQDFEKEHGIRVIAMTDIELEPAALDAEDLMALNELEKKVGTALLAVR